MSPFVFTRYLYEKEEVGYSLVLSLLNKKEDESLFWATELYYSGWEEELYELLWLTYQNFYASLNRKFEHYLLKKIKWLKTKNSKQNLDEEDTKVIQLHLIIKNMIIRPYNLDIFSLIVLTTDFEMESSINKNEDQSVNKMLTLTPDYLQIAQLLLDSWREKEEVFIEKNLESTVEFFTTVSTIETKNVIKDWHKTIELIKSCGLYFSPSLLLVTRIIHFYSLMNKLKMGKNWIFIIPEEEIITEINKYKNKEIEDTLKANHILKKVRIHQINSQISCVFKVNREKSMIDIKTAFLNDWLYYASFSPLWERRIQQYNGSIFQEQRKIVFETEEKEEEFYLRYGYEPEEQSKECQEKSIASLTKRKDKEWIENEYKKSANYLYKIEEEYLDEL